MNKKSRLVRLSLGFVAALAFGAAFVSTPNEVGAACLAVCDGGWCCCGRVSAIDWCTKQHVCVSICATQ